MYLGHWNLREEPFQNVADPRFAYLSDQHQEGLARLIYLVSGRRLGGALVGPYGVGKSMVLELLASKVSSMPGSRMIRLDVPPGGLDAIARHIGRSLAPTLTFADVASVLEAIQEMVAARSGFAHTVLALDEAQLIRDQEAFDFLRLLTNFRVPGAANCPESAAFTLILSGHGQLADMLDHETALRQRLSMVWRLEPLNEKQVIEYVELRMRAAGGDIWVFDKESLQEIAAASGGIPRLINNICDLALMIGFIMKATKITREIAIHAIEEAGRPSLSAVGGGAPPEGAMR